MNVREYTPPIYILSLSVAKDFRLAGGSSLRAALERLGLPPFPVCLIDPLKAGRARIYSGLNILALRTSVNTYPRDVVMQLEVKDYLEAEIYACHRGMECAGRYKATYEFAPYASLMTNLKGLSLGLSSSVLRSLLEQDFCVTDERQLLPVPTTPELMGVRPPSRSNVDREHLRLAQKISSSVPSTDSLHHFRWEFGYGQEELLSFRRGYSRWHKTDIIKFPLSQYSTSGDK